MCSRLFACVLLSALLASCSPEPDPEPESPVVTSVSLTLPAEEVLIGETLQATATAEDAEGAPVTGLTFQWSTSDASVATVSSSGLVRGVGAGTATISLGHEELSDSAAVTVSFGPSCERRDDPDVATGVQFVTTHPIGAKAHGCQVVEAEEGHPVLTGTRAFRFQVDPGDCSGNDGFDDCTNDRSRHEINEFGAGATDGQDVVYEESLYIPTQNLKAAGQNVVFIGQLNVTDESVFNTLAYLLVDDADRLILRTHEAFTFTPKQDYVLTDELFDRWIEVQTRVEYRSTPDGRLVVSVDGEEKVNEVRQTLPSAEGHGSWRLGIYNAFVSQATEPLESQVIYYDAVTRTLE